MIETYQKLCHTCKMESFANIVNGYKPWTIFAKCSILDLWYGSSWIRLWVQIMIIWKTIMPWRPFDSTYRTETKFIINQFCIYRIIYCDNIPGVGLSFPSYQITRKSFHNHSLCTLKIMSVSQKIILKKL